MQSIMFESEGLASSLTEGLTKFRPEDWEGLPIRNQASRTPQSGALLDALDL